MHQKKRAKYLYNYIEARVKKQDVFASIYHFQTECSY